MADIYGSEQLGGSSATMSIARKDGRPARVPVMALADEAGNITSGGKQETLMLASASVAAASQTAFGGDYIWSATASSWPAGSSVQLQALGPDGSTYQNLGAAKTASDTAGGTGVGLGSNAVVRVVIAGAPVNLYASLSRMP